MTDETTVLLVEDDLYVQEHYKDALVEAGFLVDTAVSKLEAIEKVNCRTYDVALVDVMLKGDKDLSDRGGVEVVSKISNLREGTRIVVVSATDDINVPIRTYQAGIVDFIRKGAIRSPSVEIVAVAKRAAHGVQHPLYGPFASLNAYLAAPEMTPYWESALIGALGCDFQTATDVLAQAFGRFLPILRVRDQSGSITLDLEKKCISGSFWSKRRGHAIWVSICASKSDHAYPTSGKVEDQLFKRTKGRLKGAVWYLDGVSRDNFCADLWTKF
jgi:ActR/RegA family two-component response regulator